MVGGQSIPKLDWDLAPYVGKSYYKNLKKILVMDTVTEPTGWVKQLLDWVKDKTDKHERFMFHVLDDDKYNAMVEASGAPEEALPLLRRALGVAWIWTRDDTYQAMEAMMHNFNTMHSRAGAQVPFSSINYGTDTSAEGRMVISQCMLALEAGLGMGETSIFPIHIFKVKDGVNGNPGDPNYDLFELSCEVSAKRLFPNHEFLDADFNLQYYVENQPDTEVSTMGCRTRVMANVYDPTQETTSGRGNLSFTTVNLPRLAIEAKGDTKKFLEKVRHYTQMSFEQLAERFEVQAARRVYNYPFLMGNAIWKDSEKLGDTDEVREVLKHGTLTVGFAGLAEAMVALFGKHHAEDEEVAKFAFDTIKMMREMCDARAQEKKMNYTLIATPAESTCGRLLRCDQKTFGIIPGVTDREYYTNSFHVPVYYPINFARKIDIEAPYHKLCNGGHISYVELDGDPSNNVQAFMEIVQYMKKKNMGYVSINHAVDFDPVCGYVGIIGDCCPRCGRKDGDEVPEDMLEKIQLTHHGRRVVC